VKGRAGHPLFSHARFDAFEDVKRLTERSGFDVLKTVSTLFQGPGETVVVEESQPGFVRGASFVVLVASSRRNASAANT